MNDRRSQDQTPYLDAMLRYRERGYTPFHTPGHKLGRGAPRKMIEAFGLPLLQVDVARAGGIEDTRESTGLIAAAEALAAEAWGADRCFFLINGSTSGLHAVLLALAGPGDHVIVPRNAHKALHAALVFSGAMPHYVEPTVSAEWGIPLNVPAVRVADALGRWPEAKGVFLVSPSYNGLGCDLEAVAGLAHAAGMPFVVDQAWGPHLRFASRLPIDAMTAGADAAVASTHKLISGLTQSSVLLANAGRISLSRLESIVSMTQSTSPQALMYASIDGARAQMATEGDELWARALDLAEWARAEIAGIDGIRCLGHEITADEGVASFDPTRLTVSVCERGLSGYALETVLRDRYAITVEAADPLSVVLNVTIGDDADDLHALVDALRDLSETTTGTAVCADAALPMPSFSRQVMSPRDAFFSVSEPIQVAQSVGCVSAEIVTPYPPGIPVVAPGEEVSTAIADWLAVAGARGLHVHGPEDPTLRTLRVVS